MAPAEKSIVARIAKARGTSVSRLGLRFDRVVQRVATDLRAHATGRVPEGVVVLVTLTAPILQPARTVAALQTLVDQLLASGAEPREVTTEIQGNGVRLRLRPAWPRLTTRLLLFVHNRDVDARSLLDDVMGRHVGSREARTVSKVTRQARRARSPKARSRQRTRR